MSPSKSVTAITIASLQIASFAFISIENAGFEMDQLLHQNTYNYDDPIISLWTLYDPHIVTEYWSIGVFNPSGGSTFNDAIFNDGVPEANQAGWLEPNATGVGLGEFGIFQALTGNTVTVYTTYTLTVWIGDPAINTWSIFSRDGIKTYNEVAGFPGYKVQLLADDIILAQDDDSLFIPEAQWKQSIISITIDANNPNIGKTLGIRIINKNLISGGYYVAFDDVQLEAITSAPTNNPSVYSFTPTEAPSKHPAESPTKIPVRPPTLYPSKAPTNVPTNIPSFAPTQSPTKVPVRPPISYPSQTPLRLPTNIPSVAPTKMLVRPSISYPSKAPYVIPTIKPSKDPTLRSTTKAASSSTNEPILKTQTAVTERVHSSTTETHSNDATKQKHAVSYLTTTISIVAAIVVPLSCCSCVIFCVIYVLRKRKRRMKPGTIMMTNTAADNIIGGETDDDDDDINADTVCREEEKAVDIALLNAWFRNTVKLPQYAPLFIENGYESLKAIQFIESRSDLRDLGITSLGHQALILGEIKRMTKLTKETYAGNTTAGEMDIEQSNDTGYNMEPGAGEGTNVNKAMELLLEHDEESEESADADADGLFGTYQDFDTIQ